MTTSQSPYSKVKAQADMIANVLKKVERGDPMPDAYARMVAARQKESVKFGIVMDDKTIICEMPWTKVAESTKESIAEWIVNYMLERRGN